MCIIQKTIIVPYMMRLQKIVLKSQRSDFRNQMSVRTKSYEI